MTKRDPQIDSLSINDFSDKCRICLKNCSEMVDIFTSGISSQIMEVTNIEILSNDKLPRNMCQNCGEQLRELHKFQCLAKESDSYLRALLNSEEVMDQSNENLCLKSVKRKKRKMQGKLLRLKSSQRSKENLGNDKMYLILVTEASNKKSQNEICIKDLDGENENEELTKFCKSLIKNQSSDNSLANDHESGQKTQIDVIDNNNVRKIHKVNLFIYNCNECEKAFELEELLIEHLRSCHKTELLYSSFSYKCPVCVKSESDKNLFMIHLSDHKKDGSLFVKVDSSGNNIPLSEFEEEVFEVPNLLKDSIVRNKIFKMNENCYKCHLCKKIVSVNTVNEHLKICYSNLKDCDLLPRVKYSCPACSESWVDDIESLKLHLPSHRADNVFFVKVDNCGESISLTEEDIAFTEFEKALEILDFDCRVDEEVPQCHLRKRIVKLLDLFSCLICDFESESVTSCSEHYLEVHKDMTIPVTELSCPVCSENFNFIDESVKYFDHLKNHKAEGINFLRIDKNGSFVRKSNDSSGLFTDLNELFNGRVKCSDFISDVYVPEVFLDGPVDGCVCESDHKEFTSKEEIVSHVKMTGANKSNREYVCEKCGRKCFGRGNYKRHFTTHTEKRDTSSGSKRPSCSVCKKTFSNRTSLNEHRKHHAIEENDESDGDADRKICEICGRKLSNNASLAKHRRLHLSNRESSLLKCKICERGFRREPALNRHVSHHLNPNYFECEVCKLPLPSLASLQRHKLWHEGSSNTHDCKVCKLSFLTKDRLTAHQTHTGHHQDRKRFECNVCHERFFVGREFSQHIKMHPKYKMSECSLCGKRLSTMQSLMLHLSRHFESNSILCPHCGKQFFEERNYHRHLLTHKGVKPFSCDFEGCKKSFYTYFELNRHKKYHNNTRDFNCPYCPKSFHEANHLKVHIRTHTGERPYTCPHCNKGFVTRTRCKQHINLIHQGVGCDLIQSNITKKVAVFEALETVA